MVGCAGLGWLRTRAEAEVLAVEGRLVLLPDHPQRVDGLVGAAAALVGVDAEGLDLLAHPARRPTPRNRRPPERRSMVAQRLASWSGWCSGSTRMPVPSRIRSVCAASQASRSSGSGSSQSSGSGMRPVSLYG